jgi:micrococcal nuclease
MKKYTIILICLFIIFVVLWLVHQDPKFLYVIDGDTIKIEYQGKEESMRMIWIDAPESTTLRYWYTQSWGNEATRHLEDILSCPGKIDIVLLDHEDAYWRKLWSIYLEWENVNEAMVDDWFAKAISY